MATYKTKDGRKTGIVPGVGEIKDGLLKNAPDNLESPNLVKVEETAQPAAPAQSAPAPAQPPVAAPSPDPKPAVAPTPPAQNEQPKENK